MTVIQKEIQAIRTLLAEANGRLNRLEGLTRELEQVNSPVEGGNKDQDGRVIDNSSDP